MSAPEQASPVRVHVESVSELLRPGLSRPAPRPRYSRSRPATFHNIAIPGNASEPVLIAPYAPNRIAVVLFGSGNNIRIGASKADLQAAANASQGAYFIYYVGTLAPLPPIETTEEIWALSDVAGAAALSVVATFCND